jgi:hypothetical protein
MFSIPSPAPVPLTLPASCGLLELGLSSSFFAVEGLEACKALQYFTFEATGASLPFATIAFLPSLVNLQAEGANFSDGPVRGYGGGLTGGALTHFIFENLNTSNPKLEQLYLGAASVNYSRTLNDADNWPHPKSDSLTTLYLSALQSLRSGPMGPADVRWLADLPSLIYLYLESMYTARVNTNAFAFASVALTEIDLSFTPVVGDLTPLYRLRNLVSLDMSFSGVNSQLPSNISQWWPSLGPLRICCSALWGSLLLRTQRDLLE